jgi:uncharacterized protein (DUF3084 family)
MTTKLNIRFLEDGKWSDHPSQPVFDVKAGDEKQVSARLAKLAIDAGKAVILDKDCQPMSSGDENLSAREADLVTREIALDEDEAELMTAKESFEIELKGVEAFQIEIKGVQQAFAEREAVVVEREESITAREQALTEREEAVAAREKKAKKNKG